MPSRQARQMLNAALLLVTTSGGVVLTVLLEAHRRQPAYAMPLLVVVVAGSCVALIAAGGVLAVRTGRLSPWLAPVGAMALLYGFLVAGVFIVVPVVVLSLLLSRRGRRGTAGPRALSLGAPTLLTVGVVTLSLLALDGAPIVECLPLGVSSATPVWTWFGGGSMAGTMVSQSGGESSSLSAPQRSTGAVTEGGVTYTYTCDGARLVQFSSG